MSASTIPENTTDQRFLIKTDSPSGGHKTFSPAYYTFVSAAAPVRSLISMLGRGAFRLAVCQLFCEDVFVRRRRARCDESQHFREVVRQSNRVITSVIVVETTRRGNRNDLRVILDV